MGLEAIFRAGKKTLTFSLPLKEIEEIISLYPGIEEKLDNIFNTDQFGKEKRIMSKHLLLANIQSILEIIGKDNLYKYSISYSYLGTKCEGDTNLTGLKINGELFEFRSGRNRCELIQVLIDENGMGHEGKVIDIRDKEFIEEDEIGTIKINKKKVPFDLKKLLIKLKNSLNRLVMMRKLLL